MRTRQRATAIALATLAALAVVAVAYAIFSRKSIPEPSYAGEPLSEWLVLYERPGRHGGVPTAAERAIRSIGTNALPCLLEWIRYELPPWRRALLKVATWPVPGKTLDEGKVVYGKSSIEGKSLRRAEQAQVGFALLYTNAVSAIPELEALMKNNRKPSVGLRAIYALSEIGIAALPALTNALANVNQTNRIDIIYAIYGMVQNSPYYYRDTCRAACLPALTRALSDPDPGVSRQAETTLYNLAPHTLTDAGAK
jgi:hypothetical protein